MNKILLLSFLLITTTLFAQKSTAILENEVPKNVVESFYKNMKPAKDEVVTWKHNSGTNQYSASFYKGVMRIESYILADGQFLRTCEDLKLKDIPSKISKYISEKIPNGTIVSAYKWTRKGGDTYEVKVSRESSLDSGRSFSTTKSYVFDADANLIRVF